MTVRDSRRLIASALLAMLALGAQAQTPTGFLSMIHEDGGQSYKYVRFVPPGYDASKKWPAIVFLHGAGECGTDGWKQVAQGIGTAVLWNVQKWPFVVLFPQKPVLADPWEKYDSVVLGMLGQAKKDLNIDEKRVYLTGLSQGGHGTWAIAARHSQHWAAIAPICGYGNGQEYAQPLKDMPIWVFHGDADTAVPLKQSQDIVAAIQAAGGKPKLTVYPGVGHNSWDKAYREERLAEWFLEFARK